VENAHYSKPGRLKRCGGELNLWFFRRLSR